MALARLCAPRAMAAFLASKAGSRSLLPLSSSMATMRAMPASEHKIQREEFFSKNERLSRPLSPHLTIYKPQWTSMLSITHRGTGCFQSALLSGFALGVMVMPGNFPSVFMALQEMHFGPAIIFLAKWCIAWPFAFHLLNGVRHLGWDVGYGFHIPDLYRNGYVVCAVSLALAAWISLM